MLKNKANILTGIAVSLCLACLLFASPRGNIFTQRVYKDNGNTRLPFVVSVASTSWSTILSADGNRRYAIMHTSSTATADICLSTTTTAAADCSATTPGIKLGQVFESYEDYSQAALYGRSFADSVGSTYIYGEYHYDSRDSALTE